MKPRIGYKDTTQSTNRYLFLYPNAEGYKNWRWTSFDDRLQESIENQMNGFSMVAHINQPTQANGKSFYRNMENLFHEGELSHKDLGKKENISGILNNILNIIFNGKNDNQFYFAFLNSKNRSQFFNTRDLGCFWYIFILKNCSDLKRLSDYFSRKSITNDHYFEKNSKIPCVFYRDYLNNSLAILSNDEDVSHCIEKYVSEKKIFIGDKQIDNIFDGTYIDDLPNKRINE